MDSKLDLKKLRKDRNLTQKDIATILGVSQNCYSMLENGLRSLTVKYAKKLGILYNINWWLFFEK